MTEECDRCEKQCPDGHCKHINTITFRLKTTHKDLGQVEKDQYSEKLDNAGGKYCKDCITELTNIINESFDINTRM